MQQSVTRTQVRLRGFEDEQIDCPECGTVMTARLAIRESNSGIAIVACLGCRKVYPVEMTNPGSKPEE
jgi:hypothetical protein